MMKMAVIIVIIINGIRNAHNEICARIILR